MTGVTEGTAAFSELRLALAKPVAHKPGSRKARVIQESGKCPFNLVRATHPDRPTRLAVGLGLKVPRLTWRVYAPRSRRCVRHIAAIVLVPPFSDSDVLGTFAARD